MELPEETGIEVALNEESNQSERDYFFVSTLEGNIQAYSSRNNKELWKISLGKPLIVSNISSKNILYDKNAIIPGLDGNIYRYISKDDETLGAPSEKSETYLRKVELPLKTLIDKSPFTFPGIPDYLFIGDKKSSMYTIDVDKGIILSKHANGEDNIMHRRAVQSNNLLTVIRIDYTLTCMTHEGNQSWNVTVSEVMAIQKGTKSEITLKRHRDEFSSCGSVLGRDIEKYSGVNSNSNSIDSQLQQLMDSNPGLNSIVSVHKYSNDDNVPVKIYDIKPNFNNPMNNQFVDYFNQRRVDSIENFQNSYKVPSTQENTSSTKEDLHELLTDYLEWSKEKLKNKNSNSKKTWINLLIFKFWEMYYYRDFFFVYMTIIFLLAISVIVLSTIIIKYIRRNNKLKSKVEEMRKMSEGSLGNSSGQVIMEKNQERKEEIDYEKNTHSIVKKMSESTSEDGISLSYKKIFAIEEYDKSKNSDNSQNSINSNISKEHLIKENHSKIQDENLLNKNEETALAVYNNKNLSKFPQLTKFYNKEEYYSPNVDTEIQLKQQSVDFGSNNLDKFSNKIFDLGLQKYQKEVVSQTNVKFYKTEEGEYVQEENHVVITKFESSEEVEKKVQHFNKQVQDMRRNFDSTHANSNNSRSCNKSRTYSCDYNTDEKISTKNIFSYGTINEEEESNETKSMFNNSQEIFRKSKSRENSIKCASRQNSKGEINFSVFVKKDKKETQVIIDNKVEDENLVQVEGQLQKIKNKNITLNENETSLQKYNSNSLVIFQEGKNCKDLQIQSPTGKLKRKYNFKEYSKFNHEKINTTHIDEGRLDKTFEDVEKIGQGGFGCVFKARHKIDGSNYAIKMIELKVYLSQSLMDHKVIKEVKTMMKLNHKNVVRYTTCWFQLKIDSIRGMIDMSKMGSEQNTLNSVTVTNRSFSRSQTFSRAALQNKNNLYNKDKTFLNEISENEEKSSIKSKSGFDWDESITKKEEGSVVFLPETKENMNNTKNIQNEIDKAFSVSVSFEKIENNSSNSEISNDKNSQGPYDDSYYQEKRKKNEFSYTVYFFMQMEFCDGLPLNQFLELNKERGLDKKLIFNFFKQIVSGVNHIHKNNVIHRDLK
jgi:hypothetical protein